MRVDPSGSHQPLPAAPPAARKPTGSAASAADSKPGAFTPTADLAGLLSAVRDTPEVRAEVVAAAAARVAAGEFDTPEAAADTARAMLGERGVQ